MKTFSERNRLAVGAIGVALTAGAVIGALQYKHLPFIDHAKNYSAYFAEAGGLVPGAAVQVSGLRVGEVSSLELDGARVLVKFKVDSDIRLGDRTEAAVKTKSLLGAKVLEVTPRGDASLAAPISLERTTSAYQLPDALGDLTTTISELDTAKVSDSLRAVAQTFRDTPPELQAAVKGTARLAETLDARDADLRKLLQNANSVTSVLAERAQQVAALVADTNALLAELRTQSAALDRISGNISAVSKESSAFVADNRSQLRQALDKVNGVLTIVDNRKERLQKSIKLLNSFAMSLGESVSSGPFFKAYVANLLPGQFIQPFVDAAFSDLGLDPAVLMPSQLADPQTGQPATPPLPLPYPRTGQGGEPRTTLPDAITGKPGDPRYPYHAPPPAPPPGGPPPGPPAAPPAGMATAPGPAPQPAIEPAPGAASPPAGLAPGAALTPAGGTS
ncbi:MCE family protein [Mycobacterium colombiense]